MIAVFVGPTLPRARVDALLAGRPAVVLPPAAQGDVYRALRHKPKAIALIDGYFGEAPAVWHKELLWALHEGIAVFGAASMGALRAAELAPFGMVGVGEVFEAYRDGRLVDDDEVALCHGPAELGYVALSEPMVNLRASFDAARAAGVISRTVHEAALRIGRALHYPQRSGDAVLRGLAADGHDPGPLRDWLPTGRVDQKALDAEALLQHMAEGITPAAPGEAWHFERTAMWDELVRLHGSASATPHQSTADAVLRALKQEPDRWRAAAVPALASLLASDLAKRDGKPVEEDELLSALADLRHRHALHAPEALSQWMLAQGLGTDALVELLANRVRLNRVVSNQEPDLETHVVEYLQFTGDYAALRNRL
jgi:hypothetical protein